MSSSASAEGAGEDAEDVALARERPRLEVRAGGELRHVAQPLPGGEQRGVGRRVRVVEDDPPVGQDDDVAFVEQLVPRDADAVQPGPVEAAQVAQDPAAGGPRDLRVPAGQQHVGEDEVAVVRAPQHRAVAAQGEDLARPFPRREAEVGHLRSSGRYQAIPWSSPWWLDPPHIVPWARSKKIALMGPEVIGSDSRV